MDRRRISMKEIIVPIIIATIVGASSSYMATVITLERLQTKLIYIERDLVDFKELITAVNNNHKEILLTGVWIKHIDKWKIDDEKWKEKIEYRVANIELKFISGVKL